MALPISARRHDGSFARMAAIPIARPVSRSTCNVTVRLVGGSHTDGLAEAWQTVCDVEMLRKCEMQQGMQSA